MQPIVRGVGNQDIEALAQYIANYPWIPRRCGYPQASS